VEDRDGLPCSINLIEDPVAAHANTQQVSATVRECPGRTLIIGETIRGIENLS
jgi:hypothetical protein